MPQGIGPIGIYHSHPASSTLFHSHTDDKTLVSLTNQFQNCVSIVTNGEDINFYQMGKEEKTKEIKSRFYDPEVPKFIRFVINEEFIIKINQLNDSLNTNSIKMKILNILTESFRNYWNEIFFSLNVSPIKENLKIKNLLTDNISKNPIYMKMPQETKELISNLLILEDVNINGKRIEEYNITNITLNLTAQFLVYITDTNKELSDIKNLIRVEFLGNILPQKFHSSILELHPNILRLPYDILLNYFGFYIRLISFNDKNLNEITLSQLNFDFVEKILNSLTGFTNLKTSKRIKNNIIEFLNHVSAFSTQFNWEEKIKERINQLRGHLD